VDDRRFDALVKAAAKGGASRRRLVKGLVGAAVAGVTALRSSGDAAAGVCSGEDQCDGTGSRTCGGSNGCRCYRRIDGGKVCGRESSIDCGDRCRRDSQCRRGYVCSSGGPACCGRDKSFCVKRC